MDFGTDAVVFVVVVVFTTTSRSSCANSIDLSHFTWQSMCWASEAFIRKVQPDCDYSKTEISKLETSDHSATVRGPHLVTAYKLSGLSGYR